jgi:hypothetical protein
VACCCDWGSARAASLTQAPRAKASDAATGNRERITLIPSAAHSLPNLQRTRPIILFEQSRAACWSGLLDTTKIGRAIIPPEKRVATFSARELLRRECSTQGSRNTNQELSGAEAGGTGAGTSSEFLQNPSGLKGGGFCNARCGPKRICSPFSLIRNGYLVDVE